MQAGSMQVGKPVLHTSTHFCSITSTIIALRAFSTFERAVSLWTGSRPHS